MVQEGPREDDHARAPHVPAAAQLHAGQLVQGKPDDGREDGVLRSYKSTKKMSLEESDARGTSGYGGYDAAASVY